MKISVLSALTLSALLFTSCSQMKKQMNQPPSKDMGKLMETVQIDDEDLFEKTDTSGEYLHEMAEADADDHSIKKEVGDAEIDVELPESERDNIPYSRNFLLKKNTKRMQFWVEYFTKKNRERFQRFINNGEEYRHHIESILVEQGLPKELYYVGLIESGYYLGAKSHASAVGPWQFIKGTGTRYGLRVTSEIDERRDLFKATKAAAMYFKDLHNVFSSWELALAAYNAGEYGIIRRIMKHGTRDFYELSRNKQLPSETINYVPKVLAAMHIINNAKKYGFDIPKKQNRFFDLTELKAIKKNVPLSTIAKRLNISRDHLMKLNPELKKNSTPRALAGTYYLRVPKSQYAYRIENLESARITESKAASVNPSNEMRKERNRRTAQVEHRVDSYKVKRGDTLVSIARKFDVKPGELAVLNGLKTWRTRVKIGQTLKVNGSHEKAPSRTIAKVKTPKAKVKVTNKPIVYKVKAGDNLTNIAKVFDLNLSKIKKANNLKRGHIMVGQKIVLPDTKKGIYTVKKGDHLTKVARKFNQDMDALIKMNSLKAGTIYPGQKLIVNMD